MPEKSCENCGNSKISYGGRICLADVVAKPVETVRDYRGRCGLPAKLWKPVEAPAPVKRRRAA